MKLALISGGNRFGNIKYADHHDRHDKHDDDNDGDNDDNHGDDDDNHVDDDDEEEEADSDDEMIKRRIAGVQSNRQLQRIKWQI